MGFSQSKSPNEKLNIDIIGTANLASSNIARVKSQNIVALTEAVLLGNVAFRAGKKLEWDAANLKVTNCAEAMKFIRREYRKGWAI